MVEQVVRFGGVLDQWGRVPGAAGTEWELGRRAGQWLLELARQSGGRIEVAFDYSTDFELLEYAVRDRHFHAQIDGLDEFCGGARQRGTSGGRKTGAT